MQKNAVQRIAEPIIGAYDEKSLPAEAVPDYLEENYWWAYLHPKSMRFFEQQWVINSILWGNYARLRDATLDEMGSPISGRTLQVACVYGNLTPKLARRHRADARLDVVDVAPIQLENLSRKLNGDGNRVFLDRQDASSLDFNDASFDQVLMFFLLHELPRETRICAATEALRVLKPGGKLILVDYHQPIWQHPHRYLMPLVFKTLEPFALDLWGTELTHWIKADKPFGSIKKKIYFGGLYQKVVIEK
ncbi:MAG: class I SAM-dependent methyltransferase [Chromatiaceae bacterium]|nr:class I SAM-dependent methyltransferase [Chromatiaceae bacterium]MCP5444463.1 class I SAM-dependent methyltransferase [Chromatiaceae bacterium]